MVIKLGHNCSEKNFAISDKKCNTKEITAFALGKTAFKKISKFYSFALQTFIMNHIFYFVGV